VTFPSAGVIDVRATTTAPGVFAKVVGAAFKTVTVKAHAQAQVSVPLFMKDVAPVCAQEHGRVRGHRPDLLREDRDPQLRREPGGLEPDRLDQSRLPLHHHERLWIGQPRG